MPTHGESLRAAFDSRDLEKLVGLLDERVIWRGLSNDDHEHDENVAHAHDHADQENLPLCTDRDQVRAVFERSWRDAGQVIRSSSPKPATR